MSSPGQEEDAPRAISTAILTRLRGAVDPVHDGDVPLDDDGRPVDQRYAVVWFQTPQRGRTDLAGTPDQWTRTWSVTSVGTSREQVEWVADRCQDALLDAPLQVAGWELGDVEHTSSAPIRIDRDIPGDDVFYGVDTFTVTATR